MKYSTCSVCRVGIFYQSDYAGWQHEREPPDEFRDGHKAAPIAYGWAGENKSPVGYQVERGMLADLSRTDIGGLLVALQRYGLDVSHIAQRMIDGSEIDFGRDMASVRDAALNLLKVVFELEARRARGEVDSYQSRASKS